MAKLKRMRASLHEKELLAGDVDNSVVVFDGGEDGRPRYSSTGFEINGLNKNCFTFVIGDPGDDVEHLDRSNWTHSFNEDDCTQMIRLMIGLRRRLVEKKKKKEAQ